MFRSYCCLDSLALLVGLELGRTERRIGADQAEAVGLEGTRGEEKAQAVDFDDLGFSKTNW
jgi:hypothetical protein